MGKIAIHLLENDELIGVEVSSGEDDILVASHNGKAIRFNETDVRNMGRDSQGVRSMKLSNDDFIVDLAVIKPDSQIITISSKGYGKRSSVNDYRVQSRGGMGVKAGVFNEKTGHLVALKQTYDDNDILLIADNGIIIRTPLTGISQLSRVSQGVKIMRLKDENEIVSAALVKKEEENENEYDENNALQANENDSEEMELNNLTKEENSDNLGNQENNTTNSTNDEE